MNDPLTDRHRRMSKMSGTISGVAKLMYMGLGLIGVLIILKGKTPWANLLPRFFPMLAIAALIDALGRLIHQRCIIEILEQEDSEQPHAEPTSEAARYAAPEEADA